MSTTADTKRRRTRRSFADAYKTGAVRLVLDEAKTVAAGARDLGLTESFLRNWVAQARADRIKGKTGLTAAAREILKNAAAFFAKQSRRGLPSSRRSGPSIRSPFSVAVCA